LGTTQPIQIPCGESSTGLEKYAAVPVDNFRDRAASAAALRNCGPLAT